MLPKTNCAYFSKIIFDQELLEQWSMFKKIIIFVDLYQMEVPNDIFFCVSTPYTAFSGTTHVRCTMHNLVVLCT
jgi:hypothetical protein